MLNKFKVARNDVKCRVDVNKRPSTRRHKIHSHIISK